MGLVRGAVAEAGALFVLPHAINADSAVAVIISLTVVCMVAQRWWYGGSDKGAEPVFFGIAPAPKTAALRFCHVGKWLAVNEEYEAAAGCNKR